MEVAEAEYNFRAERAERGDWAGAGFWPLAELMFSLMRMIDTEPGHDSITAPDDMMMTPLSLLSCIILTAGPYILAPVASSLSWSLSITHSPSSI